MFCGNCGNELRYGVSFCPKCGTQVLWEGVAGAPNDGAPYQGARGNGATYQGAPYQGVPGNGAPYQSAPYQGTPNDGNMGQVVGGVQSAVSSVSYSAKSALTQAASQTSGTALRMTEGAVLCVFILVVLFLPAEMAGPVGLTPFDLVQMGDRMSSYAYWFLSMVAMAPVLLAVTLIVAVFGSGYTAFLCFTRQSNMKFLTSWCALISGVAEFVIVSLMTIEINSGSYGAAIGLGAWLAPIVGIACVVLDFMRASKANQFPGVNQPPMA